MNNKCIREYTYAHIIPQRNWPTDFTHNNATKRKLKKDEIEEKQE